MKRAGRGSLVLALICLAAVVWLVVRTMAGGSEDGTAGAPAGETAPPSTFATFPSATPSASSAPATSAVPKPSPPPSRPSATPSPSPTPTPSVADTGPTGTDTRDWDGIDACRDSILPPELDEVADDVEDGGPFAYPGKDGSTFGNYEGYLPDERRGYYREYTVETPGLHHRGARRIITGGDARDPEVWYYTDDHYETFCEFAP
ncbi:hypothetical protein GCM10009584_12910 [Ornithinimicrobium humiphilum]|uniref:Guanyl-specific ribonuclease Sa n=1 Tax=Ornithinimicrobium humiphilum TaxID=125288 RepID=A0A543KJX9_9MICO|nr:ribonuclease domain-containing protein [Ornithinimicrobium humiphilum]TQM95391.1 guanyl-specific ribonuclease Sa [Ornithinimicrobium humiphilum]